MKNFGKVLLRFFTGLLIILTLGIITLYITGFDYIFPAVRKTIMKGYSTTNIDDHVDFGNRTIRTGTPQAWEYHESWGKFQVTDTLRKELEDYQSIGFAVIKEGKMLYEEYWDGYSDESLTNSFSMAKTITTMLLGKAIEQGKIKGMDQLVIDFIPEFKDDPYGKLATVGDLSAMRSGFDWKEEYYSPFNMTTEAYFGKDVEKQLLKRGFARQPGGKFKYSSADTQLLAIVLKRATGKDLSTYLSESLWQPMGMEHDALWSISGDIEKTFCCVHSNVRDYAKLGQLLLQKGKWNGRQLLDSAFVELMITPNIEAFDPEEPKRYGYSVWIDSEHNPPIYGMMGHLGQRIIVIPDYDVVIVRLGKSKDDLHPSRGSLDADVYYFVDEVIKGLDLLERQIQDQAS